MLNIASVNMPKIKPETSADHQDSSPSHIFNVSKWQVERIRKHYQETGDVHDRPRLGRPRKTTARDDSLLVQLSKARPMSTTSQLVSSRTVHRILARNGLHGRIAAQKPALNKRQPRNRVVYAKVHSFDEMLDSRKVAKNLFFR